VTSRPTRRRMQLTTSGHSRWRPSQLIPSVMRTRAFAFVSMAREPSNSRMNATVRPVTPHAAD